MPEVLRKPLRISEDEAQMIAKALSDPRRYEILQKIGAGAEALACEAIRECAGISPATLSHHMKELETAGLVTVERKGRFAYYSLRKDRLEAFFHRLRQDLG